MRLGQETHTHTQNTASKCSSVSPDKFHDNASGEDAMIPVSSVTV